PAAHSSPRSDETARTSTLDRMPDPSSLDLDKVWETHWQQNLLAVAMANVKRQVSAKQFLLFYQQVVNAWPAAKVAQKYNVNLSQVYMARYRVARLVKKEARKLQARNPCLILLQARSKAGWSCSPASRRCLNRDCRRASPITNCSAASAAAATARSGSPATSWEPTAPSRSYIEPASRRTAPSSASL